MDLINFEFHDLDIQSIEFDFHSGLIEIIVCPYDDTSQLYRRVKLKFTKVGALSMIGEAIIDWESEVYTADFDESCLPFRFRMMLLNAIGKPSFEISFSYQNCTRSDEGFIVET
jgi:hypothetical protein